MCNSHENANIVIRLVKVDLAGLWDNTREYILKLLDKGQSVYFINLEHR